MEVEAPAPPPAKKEEVKTEEAPKPITRSSTEEGCPIEEEVREEEEKFREIIEDDEEGHSRGPGE